MTPVEIMSDMMFKRGDAYRPFDDLPLNGDKLRQCYALLQKHKQHIEEDCDGQVWTAGGMHSPQGIIVTKVARELGFDPTIFYGASKAETALSQDFVRHILNNGGSVNLGARVAFDSAINAYIKKQDARYFNIGFGMNLDGDTSLYDIISDQCENLPRELDTLVVPVGSGIVAGGILRGVKRYGIKVNRIVLVQIAGHDRRKTIQKICDEVPYEWYESHDYPYTKHVWYQLDDDEYLDPVYEGKAYDYVARYLPECINQDSLFYIAGNTTAIRQTPAPVQEYEMDGDTIQLCK